VDLTLVRELFRTKGGTLFKRRAFASFRRGPRYDAAVLRSTLEEYLRGRQLREAKVPLVIPSASVDQFGHHVFSTKTTPAVIAEDAIMASSAAPTYFAPIKLKGQTRSYADGGVWANNPALVAVMHAIKHYKVQRDDIRLLILGNGHFPAGTKIADLLRARPYSSGGIGALFDLMFAAQETAAEHYAEQLLQPSQVKILNMQLPIMISLDDVTESLVRLEPLAEQLAQDTWQDVQAFLTPTAPAAAASTGLLQSPPVPAELARAATTLSARIHITIISNPWVEREEEGVVLTTPTADDAAVLKADTNSIFRCDVMTKRRGNVCRAETKIGFRLQPFRLPEQVDFEYIVGRGLLNAQAHQQLADGITPDAIDKHIGVQHVLFRNGHEEIRYADVTRSSGPGYFIFTYRCPNDFTAFDKYTELDLRIRTYLSRDQAWYTYLTNQTITKHLTVSFQAPFQVAGKQHLGSVADEIENQRIAETYYSAFTVDGPVPAGSTVDWIFEREHA
jgi:hypothetical protein